MKRAALATFLLLPLLLAACGSSGPVRRVSEPSASIQQLSVRADGSWSLDLRINNFSSIPMRFDALDLGMTVEGQPSTSLRDNPGFTIGPESADIVTLQLVPSAGAKIAVADALARGNGIRYELKGNITATPEQGKQRVFQVERDNALAPVPGLPGVLR